MNSKLKIAIGLGVVLVALVVGVAVASGLGHDDVPDSAVAVVDGTEITEDDFNASLEQAAKRQGLPEVPAEDDPQYDAIRDAAIGDQLDIVWIQKEADERGVEVSDRQIEESLAQTKEQNFPTEKKFQEFLEQSGFTPEDVDLRIKLQLLSQAIQDEVAAEAAGVTDAEVEDFYNQNSEQFEQPAQRDIRLILNKDAAKVDEAKAELEKDPSDKNWKKVAAEFSTDPSSKDTGGARQGITPGVLEGDLDSAVFEAPLNTIQGPVTTELGTYIFEVTKETPAATQSLDEVRDQLKQQLEGQAQQEDFSAFVEDYRGKWTELTICADGFVIDRCDNFTAEVAAPCTDEQADSTGCPPPVASRNPLAPGGGADPLAGGQGGGAPQRPHPPGEGEAAPTGAPGGLVPGGAPPGAAPPGAAPPSGAAPPPAP